MSANLFAICGTAPATLRSALVLNVSPLKELLLRSELHSPMQCGSGLRLNAWYLAVNGVTLSEGKCVSSVRREAVK